MSAAPGRLGARPRAWPRAGPRARQRVAVATGALLLTLGGCASLMPPRSAPAAIEPPAAWAGTETLATAPANATSLAQWWQRFDDPLLTRLVTQALQANTSVNAAQAALKQARALRDVSAAGLLPAVGGSASAQHSQSGDGNGSNSLRAGLDASWELDVFGGNRAALNSSEAQANASAASLGNVQVSIAAEVALNLITLRSTQARLAIANSNLASQQETLQLTQWRLQAGLVTELEREQARGAVEQTRAQLPALQTRIDQSAFALAVLVGQPPAALMAELAVAGALPQASAELALSIPAETLRQRPDVRAAEYQVGAALGRVTQADAARLPSFKLSGSLGLNALTLGSLTSGASVVGALLAGVSMPIFDGGAGKAQVRAQEAALEQAAQNYRAAVLSALKEVEDALVALRGDRERLARLMQAAQASATAAELARQRFSSGLVDFQTVLETQRSQLSTQDGVASAQADISADHVRLYKALGGGWRAEEIVADAIARKADGANIGASTSLPTSTRTSPQ